jgi:hypothetical protein
MRTITALCFAALTGFSLLLAFSLILFGMAPMVPPLDYAGFVIYGPGPGFFLLLLWWASVVAAIAVARVVRITVGPRAGNAVGLFAWASLGGLLMLELFVLADFTGLL